MLQWFDADHLPEALKPTMTACRALAVVMDGTLPESAEKSAGMRKLVEAKDCFVRAKIEGDRQ